MAASSQYVREPWDATNERRCLSKCRTNERREEGAGEAGEAVVVAKEEEAAASDAWGSRNSTAQAQAAQAAARARARRGGEGAAAGEGDAARALQRALGESGERLTRATGRTATRARWPASMATEEFFSGLLRDRGTANNKSTTVNNVGEL